MADTDDFCDKFPEPPHFEQLTDTDTPEAALAVGVAVGVARVMILAALSQQPGFSEKAQQPSVITILEPPHAEWGIDVALAWRLMAPTDIYVERRESKGGSDVLIRAAHKRLAEARKSKGQSTALELFAFDAPARTSMRDRTVLFHHALREGLPLHAISSSPETSLPADLVSGADQRLVIARPTSGMITEIAMQFCNTTPDEVRPIDEQLMEQLRPTDLLLARRVGQTVEDYLRRLETLIRTRHRKVTGGLETLPGMGKATDVGLRIAGDLRDFAEGRLAASELDRGMVLEGPPGCGKTSFAKALAATAGVPFVAASLQDWQGAKDGHLGTLLGAMRATFDEARALAPCVLLVDELDSFGDRAAFDARHRDYSRQVVNAFLEQLDGSTSRAGVFVVGCTNDAAGLDPAILRPGRLEQVIQVPLPDAQALLEIFRRYLGAALPEADLTPLVAVAHQRRATGADVERWCRVARGTARGARRPLALQDLVDEVGEPPPQLSAEARWRTAIHEAGHAVGCLVCGPSVLKSVQVGKGAGAVPRTVYDQVQIGGDLNVLTRRPLRRHLRTLLAGRAAELELLGEVSSGAGGSEQSDLAKATALATKAVASWGLAGHEHPVVWHPVDSPSDVDALLARDPLIRARVAGMLAEAQADAVRLIRRMRVAVLAIAEALVEQGHLDAKEISRIVREIPEFRGVYEPIQRPPG